MLREIRTGILTAKRRDDNKEMMKIFCLIAVMVTWATWAHKFMQTY